MTAPGPVCNVIVVNFTGGSPEWGRQAKPDRRHHRAQREAWRPREDIPVRPSVDRELVERLREVARRQIADGRRTTEAMLIQARAMLAMA
jgi:hypothetical protein